MKKLFMIVGLCILTACAQMGVQPARGFEDNLAYTYSSVTAVRLSAADALGVGAISLQDAQKVLDLSDQARTVLDAAKAAYAVGDTATSAQRLAQATALLVQMQVYVKGKQ